MKDPQTVQLFGMLSHFLYVFKSIYTMDLCHAYISASGAKTLTYYSAERMHHRIIFFPALILKLKIRTLTYEKNEDLS